MNIANVPGDSAHDSCDHESALDQCTYCGLPVAPSSRKSAQKENSGTDAQYCCYGCRFAHAVVQEQGADSAIRWTVIRLGLAIFFTMNLMAFTMTMWSLDVYDVQPDPFQLKLFEVFRWLSMLFALPVLLLLGLPLIENAVSRWLKRDYSTDLLIGLAVTAAYGTSVVNVFRGAGSIYFEVGAMVLVMITLGRWIEAVGKQKATEVLDQLLSLLPDSVTRTDADGHTTLIPATDIRAGDILQIRAGDRFPVDGMISRGSTTVDEQVFSGESVPLVRGPGDPVLAGTINLDGDIHVRTTALFRQGSFGRLLDVLQQARTTRGYYQRLADRVASWFVPVITALAAGAFLWHLSSGVGFAIQTALSVLLIACPCALGLATPLAVWTALSTAVRHQVLFDSGESLERLADVKAICFDKTGTLTSGASQVIQTTLLGPATASAMLPLAASLAAASSHPFSQAVVTCTERLLRDRKNVAESSSSKGDCHGRSSHTTHGHCTSVRTIPGGGIEAVAVDGSLVRLGSLRFACGDAPQTGSECQEKMATASQYEPDEFPETVRIQLDAVLQKADQQQASVVVLSVGHVPCLVFLISETTRPEAGSVLLNLTASGRHLFVLSGDRPAKGLFLKSQLPVPGLNVECGLQPEDKVRRVSEVRQEFGTTVMVGDGINDAPALAASDVGVALGCGADVSRNAAHVCLLSDDLTRIPWAIALAQKTRRVIRQNLIWAFGYNTVGAGLAAAGLLNPAIAAGLMIASSLLVISNSLRLLGYERDVCGPGENRAAGEPADFNLAADKPSGNMTAGSPAESQDTVLQQTAELTSADCSLPDGVEVSA